ncbi:Pre-mRNA-splicing factor [Dirofilaria immitis]
MDRSIDNFANVLRQIEIETERDLKHQQLLDERLRILAQEPKRSLNPLRYQLIPPRYRAKNRGYAVCRPCAEQSYRQSEPFSTNFTLTDHLRESSPEELPEHSERVIKNDECYFTIELGCRLAQLTRLIFASIKVLNELKFVSDNIYPMLNNDITYLNELYLRMKSNYAQYRNLKMKQFSFDNKLLPPTIGAVKLSQNSENIENEASCDLTILEDTIDEENKKSIEEDSCTRSSRSKSETDFEQKRTEKQRFRIGSKWKRDE